MKLALFLKYAHSKHIHSPQINQNPNAANIKHIQKGISLTNTTQRHPPKTAT